MVDPPSCFGKGSRTVVFLLLVILLNVMKQTASCIAMHQSKHFVCGHWLGWMAFVLCLSADLSLL
ncbi:hypothetical protein COO60DRAFT_1589842 [Scenedesmus sp. NREL 46B-D3]|nr:hypothetical protein COO60DRAFT_1589842 [Scenedesmus sp. NREL 46B-D3]